MLDVTRSARLAAWGTAALRGEVDPARAVRAVQRDDEEHAVDDPDAVAVRPAAAFGAGTPRLADLLDGLADHGVGALRLVLPAPGDVLGLPGPTGFNALALEAGEAVLSEAGSAPESTTPAGRPSLGVVPLVQQFGSAWEPGATVTWQLHRVVAHRPLVTGSLGEADQLLREALREATEELARLDVARWRDDAATAIAAIREGVLAPDALPPSAPPRSVRVLGTAARLRAIVDLALADDGAATSGHEATRRAQALRGLDATARRAISAAVNAMLEPD
jgi:hypothetical protein